MEGKSLVAFQMQGQMVASAETPIAVATFKRLGSSVLPVMPGELVRSCKSPLTFRVVAGIGFFA